MHAKATLPAVASLPLAQFPSQPATHLRMMAEFRSLVRKYRALLLATCALGIALGLVMARRQRPTFVAVGVIQIPGGPLALSEFGDTSNHGPSPGFCQ